MERYDIRVNVWGGVSEPQYEWETVKAEDGDFVLYTDAQATVEASQQDRDALKIGLNALRDAYDELESRHNDTTAALDAERETNKALVERISKLEGK